MKKDNSDIEIQHCINWIRSCCTITKAINYDRSSYGLKHDVERWAGCYISNDAFKATASQIGLMTAPAGTINEYYNLKVLKKNKNRK